jgi:2-keto-3-deoxy-L-rhamnonate aldolase RhmA
MPEETSLKQRIRNGEIVVGIRAEVGWSQSQLEDVLAQDTYHFVTLDSQHSPYNEEKLLAFCGMASGLGMPVQFRIKHTRHAYLIGNVLDLGPWAIEVPLVEDEAVVDEAFNAFYYPQVGKRSWGGAGYNIQGKGRLEYADWWNNNGVLCLQMETVKAVTNARQLAKPGVDCLTWGPADLAFDLEAHPQFPFQTVDDCVRHVLAQLEGTGVRISFRNGTADLRNKYIDMGVTVFMERA